MGLILGFIKWLNPWINLVKSLDLGINLRIKWLDPGINLRINWLDLRIILTINGPYPLIGRG